VQLNAEVALLFLEEPPIEAVIDLSELHDEEGILRLGVGDALDAFVVEMGAKGIILSRKLPEKFQMLARLRKAQEEKTPVEGLVLTSKKTGLEVAIEQVRAFCPLNQVDLSAPENTDGLIGEKLLFHVTKVKGQQRVLLSRRTVLEEALRAKAVVVRSELSEGKVLKGVVTHLREFGAFVDLGGLEGLVPTLELSHRRTHHPSEVVSEGAVVEVKVLRIEPPSPPENKERITLSMKQCQENPWSQAASQVQVGAQYTGKVVRLAPFGAFVELFPGVDGLLHISELGTKRVAHPKEVLSIGQELQVVLDAFSVEERRASLRMFQNTPAMEFPAFSSLTQEQPTELQPPSAPSPAPPEEKAMLIIREPKEAKEAPRKTKETPRESKRETKEPPREPRGVPKEPPREKEQREPPKEREPRLRVGDTTAAKIERIEPSGLFVSFGQKQGFVPSSETATARGADLKRAFQLGQEIQAEVLGISPGEWRLSISKAQKTEERKTLETFRQQQQKSVGFGTLADKLKNLKLE
jgi:ribosomal protein S1